LLINERGIDWIDLSNQPIQSDWKCLFGGHPGEAGDTILNIVYGYNIEPHGRDTLINQVGEAMSQFSAASVPGKWAVDMLRFLERLPDWLPGTAFKQTARFWKQTMTAVA
jgi:hypothetical protein